MNEKMDIRRKREKKKKKRRGRERKSSEEGKAESAEGFGSALSVLCNHLHGIEYRIEYGD